MELVGKHAEAWCFRCHEWPNFKGLNYVCSDGHEPTTEPHFGPDCLLCHDPAGQVKPAPANHEGHINEQCTLCHKPVP